ncbi:MAG: hypothetical protein N2039_05335, partial [Gemmataceae bacterium]|nr:hypothetical protein [Gemmataceae bacterium]
PPSLGSSSSVAEPPSSSPFQEALASAGEAGTQPATSYHPGFFGDLLGGITVQNLGVIQKPYITPQPILSVNVAQASAIKVAESDSPRPIDRVYYFYNFYGNIDIEIDPTLPLPRLQLHRHVIGFEKTLWAGRASVGMRVPFLGFAGAPIYDTRFVGDLSVLTKLMLFENPETRSLFSIGFAVAPPTGSSPAFLRPGPDSPLIWDRSPRNYPTYLQPWAGYIYNVTPRWYFHGFHSVLISTIRQEPMFLANDVGAGWWLYRNPEAAWIRGIIPTIEIHVNTPVTRQGVPTQLGEVRMRDSVNLTGGFYITMPRSLLGTAVSVPLAFGPHTIEAVASYTLRF